MKFSTARHRDKRSQQFFFFYIGQVISGLGTSMTGFAVVIWAYTQFGQVMASSLLAVCSAVPYLLASLFGGAVVDRADKKRVMLLCDAVAAAGTVVLLVCACGDCLHLWLLCAVNALGGLMNAFQAPAAQVTVSLLADREEYARIGGIQSMVGSLAGMLTPVLAAALLGFGGLKLVLAVDLVTFLFAFLTLLLLVRIPAVAAQEKPAPRSLLASVREGLDCVRRERGLMLMLVLFGILEFMGALSFDSMYSPFLLARTGNDETAVGAVSFCMALGHMAGGALLLRRAPRRKVSLMFLGSFVCMGGILLFGIGQSFPVWCAVALVGCSGAPVYQTMQTLLLRECVPAALQGRVFSLQGMMTGMLAPVGYLLAAVLADEVLEPFMRVPGALQAVCARVVGTGSGAGIGLIFVLTGLTGMLCVLLMSQSKSIRALESRPNLNQTEERP